MHRAGLLIALCLLGCDFKTALGRGDKPGVSGPSAPGGLAEARPAVAVSDDDPVELKNLVSDFEAMEAAIQSGDMTKFWSHHATAMNELYFTPEEDVASHDKFPKMQQWMAAIEAELARRAGGHAVEIYGDGKTSSTSPKQTAAELAEEALQQCKHAAGAGSIEQLEEAYQAYEKTLARVTKIDPGAVRFRDAEGKDTRAPLLMCEFSVTWQRNLFADQPPQEPTRGKKYTGCGYTPISFRSLKVGKNQFAPFESLAGTASNVAMPCNKMPRKTKVAKELRAVFSTQLSGMDKGDVVVQDGGFEFQQDGLEITRWASVRVYSKNTDLVESPCGGNDPKLVCEASGSVAATTYNHLKHYLARAVLRKKGGAGEVCKELLQRAMRGGEELESTRDQRMKAGEWLADRTYQTADGAFDEKTVLAKIDSMARTAQERHDGDWCATAAAAKK